MYNSIKHQKEKGCTNAFRGVSNVVIVPVTEANEQVSFSPVHMCYPTASRMVQALNII